MTCQSFVFIHGEGHVAMVVSFVVLHLAFGSSSICGGCVLWLCAVDVSL